MCTRGVQRKSFGSRPQVQFGCVNSTHTISHVTYFKYHHNNLKTTNFIVETKLKIWTAIILTFSFIIHQIINQLNGLDKRYSNRYNTWQLVLSNVFYVSMLESVKFPSSCQIGKKYLYYRLKKKYSLVIFWATLSDNWCNYISMGGGMCICPNVLRVGNWKWKS